MKKLCKHVAALMAVTGLVAAGSVFAAGAAENFDTHCAKCHGADGKGQSKMGKKLGVRDMTSADYKKSFDEAKGFSSIKDGIKKDGKEIKKSFASELSDAQIRELLAYVKGLK